MTEPLFPSLADHGDREAIRIGDAALTYRELADAERNHRLLLDPILAGDVETARVRLEEHIDDAWMLAKTELPVTPF